MIAAAFQPSLTTLDYAVVVVYLAVVVAIGAYCARRQKSTDDYYAAGRRIPAWAVGMSILATLISSVTFLAYPGEGYTTNWIRLVQGLMVPAVLLCMIWFVVPLYRKYIRISAYEYFERRFGFFARLYSSLAFALTHFSKMGTVFYLLALAISRMTGAGTYEVILVLGALTVLYTLVGGIEAVIWSDVLQGFMLVAGGLCCLGVLLFQPTVGAVEVFARPWNEGRMGLGPFDLDFSQLTFVVMALNGVFYAIQKYGTDQTIVQRFLAAETDRKAIKASLVGAMACVPVWTMFMLIGTLLWSYYQLEANTLPSNMRPEGVFPYFIVTALPAGITGLILAALIAAAMSSLDSDLNCLSAVVVEDYYRRARPDRSDREYLRIGRWTVVVCGALAVGVACLYVKTDGKTVLSMVFTLYAIFSGGIAGLFALGFLTKRANRHGVNIGIIACVLFTAYAVLTSRPFTIGGEKKLLLDLGAWNFAHHKYMLGVYSHLVLFGVGYVASRLFGNTPSADNLTVYGFRRLSKQTTVAE
ncbi:MAG: sodium:solute symporter family protein [Planctomycetota bacterium]